MVTSAAREQAGGEAIGRIAAFVVSGGKSHSRAGRPFVVAVSAVIRDVPRGHVVSYGEVAARAGYPGAARAVGNVLANSMGLPWWRVVRANGQLAAHSRVEQARRLRREGVLLRGDRIVNRSLRPGGRRARKTLLSI